jgi:zinc and cadmium transporter
VYRTGEVGIGLYVLAGFFLQLVIEFFSEGIEHGHIHTHGTGEKAFPFAMMVGLSIHSFLEGMPLSGRFGTDDPHHTLLSGIILHHVPVAFALASMLSISGVSRRGVIAYLVLFAAMAPLGALSGEWVNQAFFTEASVYFNRMMAIVIGIFLHISTTILFETNESHRFNLYKLVVIAAGALVAVTVF